MFPFPSLRPTPPTSSGALPQPLSSARLLFPFCYYVQYFRLVPSILIQDEISFQVFHTYSRDSPTIPAGLSLLLSHSMLSIAAGNLCPRMFLTLCCHFNILDSLIILGRCIPNSALTSTYILSCSHQYCFQLVHRLRNPVTRTTIVLSTKPSNRVGDHEHPCATPRKDIRIF